METKLNWKSGLFKNACKIYSGDAQVGELKEHTWSGSAAGELNGKKYVFKTQGFFRQKTLIINPLNNDIMGEINFHTWMTKATIRIMDKIFNWKYDNWLNTKWSIYNPEEILIHYSGSFLKGKISASINEELLILTGLFVINYYLQSTIVLLVAVLLPVWITVIS